MVTSSVSTHGLSFAVALTALSDMLLAITFPIRDAGRRTANMDEVLQTFRNKLKPWLAPPTGGMHPNRQRYLRGTVKAQRPPSVTQESLRIRGRIDRSLVLLPASTGRFRACTTSCRFTRYRALRIRLSARRFSVATSRHRRGWGCVATKRN